MKILKSLPVPCMMILQNKKVWKRKFWGTRHDRLYYDSIRISTVFPLWFQSAVLTRSVASAILFPGLCFHTHSRYSYGDCVLAWRSIVAAACWGAAVCPAADLRAVFCLALFRYLCYRRASLCMPQRCICLMQASRLLDDAVQLRVLSTGNTENPSSVCGIAVQWGQSDVYIVSGYRELSQTVRWLRTI